MKNYRIVPNRHVRITGKRWLIQEEGGTFKCLATDITFLGCDAKVETNQINMITYSMFVQATLEITDGHAIFKGRYFQ